MALRHPRTELDKVTPPKKVAACAGLPPSRRGDIARTSRMLPAFEGGEKKDFICSVQELLALIQSTHLITGQRSNTSSGSSILRMVMWVLMMLPPTSSAMRIILGLKSPTQFISNSR